MSSKYRVLLGLAIITLIFIYIPVQAQNRPIQIALVTPVQIFPSA